MNLILKKNRRKDVRLLDNCAVRVTVADELPCFIFGSLK